MLNRFRSLLLIGLITLLAAMPLPAAAQATPPGPGTPAPARTSGPGASGPAWYDGSIQESTITNCISIIQGTPYEEAGAGTYAGFYADPSSGQPAINSVYYVHVVIYGLGNACSGIRAYIEISLPANTSLAINGTHPLYCFFDGVSGGSDCPQSLPASAYNAGAYAIPSTDAANAHTWPLPQGHNLEIQIPVISTAALNNSTFQANIWTLDGNSSPWLYPHEGVYVFSTNPTILYPSPATTAITTTSGHSQAYLYSYNTTGTGYFDLGTTSAYGLIHEPVAISTVATSWLVYDNWGPPALKPGTLYHWRFTYKTGSTTYYGADQTFTTLPVVATLISVATQDGWVRETGETSGVGGAINSTATTFNLGDDKLRRQVRGILSFNTSSLPDNAVITGVTLKLMESAIVGGGNPVTDFKGFMVDIKNGLFGTAALQAGDFQAPASKTYGPFKTALLSGWYSIDLTAGKAYINKLASNGGLTQLRLRFKLDDNNDAVANYLSLYSGNAPAANRPQLIITYSMP